MLNSSSYSSNRGITKEFEESLMADVVGFIHSVALVVQIHLQQNRTDLAVKEVSSARRWAQDSLLVNIAESWVGMRVVRLITLCPSTISAPLSVG